MGESQRLDQPKRSDEALARMIIGVAQAGQADAVLCATETGVFVRHLHTVSDQYRIIAATNNNKTYAALTQEGVEAIHLPLRAADRYSQIRHIISVAAQSRKISEGEVVVCTIDNELYPESGNVVVLTDVEPNNRNVAVSDLIKLTDGIRPSVIEAALEVACKVGRAARRGKRLGTIFMLGDSLNVLEGARQLIPNPFHGHDDSLRRLTNPDIYDALLELSKLDGAFVVRGDGFIQTAGVFLATEKFETNLPPGFGARHAAAAAVTARTNATAIVISATDGNVRVFSYGEMVLQIDPDVDYGPVKLSESK